MSKPNTPTFTDAQLQGRPAYNRCTSIMFKPCNSSLVLLFWDCHCRRDFSLSSYGKICQISLPAMPYLLLKPSPLWNSSNKVVLCCGHRLQMRSYFESVPEQIRRRVFTLARQLDRVNDAAEVAGAPQAVKKGVVATKAPKGGVRCIGESDSASVWRPSALHDGTASRDRLGIVRIQGVQHSTKRTWKIFCGCYGTILHALFARY